LADGAAGGVSRIVSRSNSGSGGVVCIVVICSAIVVALVRCLVAVSASASLPPDFSWDAPEVGSPTGELLSSAYLEPLRSLPHSLARNLVVLSPTWLRHGHSRDH